MLGNDKKVNEICSPQFRWKESIKHTHNDNTRRYCSKSSQMFKDTWVKLLEIENWYSQSASKSKQTDGQVTK